MTRLALALFFCWVAWPVLAQDADYLTDQALFSEAWAELESEIGENSDLAELRLLPNRIEVQAKSTLGGARIDRWRVELKRGLFGLKNDVSGPAPVRPVGPVAEIETGFFSASDLPLDRFISILSDATSYVELQDPGRVAEVHIARRVELIPRPNFADVRWRIVIGNDREQAVATAKIDGTILGVDISGTNRGRNRNFLTQDDWPLAHAEAGFRIVIGDETDIFEVSVSRTSISINAATQGAPDHITTWSWDGGRFTKGLLDMPNLDIVMPGQRNLPFVLGEVDLEVLPKILTAARAEAPGSGFTIRSVRAIKKPVVTGDPEVLWRVALSDAPSRLLSSGDDVTEVHLRTDGAVANVILPAKLRPASNYTDGPGFVAAVESLQSTFGNAALVFELTFRPDRTEMMWPDQDKPGNIAKIRLDGKGFSAGSGRPLMMETEADLFVLDVLGSLDADTIAAIQEQAVTAIAAPGAEVYRMRVWSGSPFWRALDGSPLIDVRVGMPPDFYGSGYVIFQIDGKLVEVVK